MNCKYTIKNFRVFNENGATFDLRPITILTGCNNSGKSSLVKSLLVFLDYVAQVAITSRIDKIGKGNIRLNLQDINLGTFGNTLNNNHNDVITFEISLYSHILYEEILLHIDFTNHKDYDIDKTAINRFFIKNANDTIVYDWHNEDEFIDFNYFVAKSFTFFVDENEFMIPLTRSEIISRQEEVDVKSSISTNLKDRLTFNMSQDIILNMYSWRLFYFIPLYSKLFMMKKDECINYIKNEIITNKIGTPWKEIINLVINDFEDSNDDYTLFNYVSNWEAKYFTELSHHTAFSLGNINEDIFISPEWIYEDWTRSQGIKYPLIYITFSYLDYCVNHNKSEYGIFERWNEISEINEIGDILITEKRNKSLFCNWFNRIFPEIFTREIPYSLNYIDPLNILQKKVYSIDTKDAMADILTSYLNLSDHNLKGIYGKSYRIKKGEFINKWIQILKLGEKIRIFSDDEGVGAYIKLYKENEDNGTLLIYNGSGVFYLVLILLRIEITILQNDSLNVFDTIGRNNCKELKESFGSCPHRINHKTISLIEPEAHLHPALQSKLADIIKDAYINFNIEFIIETHSEYLIRNLQNIIASKEIDNDKVSLYYLYDPTQDDIPDYVSKVKHIEINEDGTLSDSFGTGFMDEAKKLDRELLKIKINNL